MPEEGRRPLRAFGVPFGDSRTRGEEPRRILGFPATMFSDASGAVDTAWFRSAAHPLKALRRWRRHRRLGPYVEEEDD